MSARLENVLCPAQQAKAVLSLILESPDGWVDNDATLYALFSVLDGTNRILAEVDELLKKNERLTEKLLAMGIYEEVMQYINTSEKDDGAATKAQLLEILPGGSVS